MGIDFGKLGDVAEEINKSVDVKKVASETVSNGKVDLKKGIEAVKNEITAEEAANIANKAKDLFTKKPEEKKEN